MNASEWLPLFFLFAMALSMALYVVLDGYDLGVGILLGNVDTVDDRDRMIASIPDRSGMQTKPGWCWAYGHSADRLPDGARRDPRCAVPAGGRDADRPDLAGGFRFPREGAR